MQSVCHPPSLAFIRPGAGKLRFGSLRALPAGSIQFHGVFLNIASSPLAPLAPFSSLSPALQEALLTLGAPETSVASALYAAVLSDRLDLAALILPLANAHDLSSAVAASAMNRSLEGLRLLLPPAMSSAGSSRQKLFAATLFSCVYYGHHECAQLVLDLAPGIPLPESGNDDRCKGPLSLASSNGDQRMLSILLDSRAPASQSDLFPALIAGAYPGDAECLSLIIPRLSDPGSPQAKAVIGQALELAARHGRFDALSVLLRANPTKEGCSLALASASRRGHPNCVGALLPWADPNSGDGIAFVDAVENDSYTCLPLLLPRFIPDERSHFAARSLQSLADLAKSALSPKCAEILRASVEAEQISAAAPQASSMKVPRL